MGGESQRPVILAVDDDELILGSLRALFAIETDYELRAVNRPAEAERIARSQPIDLVVSDFLMPGMNGVELLKRIRGLQPDAPRILLTGFADKENAIRGINEAGLYYYLEKPWENETLLLIIRNALAQQRLRRRLTSKAVELDRLIERHGRLQESHQGLERDLEMAARVQRSLLPAMLPDPAPYVLAGRSVPSALLGGDFYDVHEREGRTTLLTADISGHGTAAALAGTLLKAGFDEAAEAHAAPLDILAAMNRRLARFLPQSMFACAAVAVIEGPDLEIANAGLPHPRIRRAAGDVERAAIEGLPLGLLPDVGAGGHDSRRIFLSAGDTLLIATDGLGEARLEDGPQYEDAQLDADLAAAPADPHGLIEAMIEGARKHAGGRPFRDDVTLVTITRS